MYRAFLFPEAISVHFIPLSLFCSPKSMRVVDLTVLDPLWFTCRWYCLSMISSISLSILSNSSCFLYFKCSNWASTSGNSYSGAVSYSSVAWNSLGCVLLSIPEIFLHELYLVHVWGGDTIDLIMKNFFSFPR